MRQRCLWLVALTVWITLPSCTSLQKLEDPSVTCVDTFGFGLQDGTAYDQASLKTDNVKKLILPQNAEVRHSSDSGKIELFMAKRFGVAGRKFESVRIRELRNHMGCAVNAEGETLLLATYGEWRDMHGGADIKIVVIVPQGIEVEQRNGLSGEDSAAKGAEKNELDIKYALKKSRSSTDYYRGWRVVKDEPDPKQNAQK